MNHSRYPLLIWSSLQLTSYSELLLSALDKLLGQLGINATWLSSIAYLQKQLRIFIYFYATFLAVITHVLLNEAIANLPTYLLSLSAFLSIKLADFYRTWIKSHRLVDISCSHPFCKVFPLKYLTGAHILFINWNYTVHLLVKKNNTRLAFVYYTNGNKMDQMVRNDIACNCIPINGIAFQYARI